METKRCNTEFGCGDELPVSDFKSRIRYREDGSVYVTYYARCIECDKKYSNIREQERRVKRSAQKREAELKAAQRECLPNDYRFFLYKLKPVGPLNKYGMTI